MKIKNPYIYIGILVITLIAGIAFFYYNNNKKTADSAQSSSSSKSNESSLPQNDSSTSAGDAFKDYPEAASLVSTIPKVTDLPKNYKIDNKLLLEQTKTSITDETGSVRVNLDDYCKKISKDDFSCKDRTIIDLRINTVANYEKRSLVMIMNQIAKDSDSGKKLLDFYLTGLKKQQDEGKLTCTVRDGLLANKDRTIFIYAFINDGANKPENQNEAYSILDSLKAKNNMEYMFRCDQKLN